MSCSARAGLPGVGYQTIPQWTTVSGSVAGISREISGLRRSASMNSVRSRSAVGLLGVDPGDELDLRVALEPARELDRPVVGDPGDEDPPSGQF